MQLGGLNVNNKPRPVVKDKQGGGIGGAIGRAIGFDITPGFNINSRAGGGVPYVSRGDGSTGQPPASGSKASPKAQNNDPGNTTTYSDGGGSGSGYDPGDLAYLDNQSSQLRRLLASADRALRSGLTNLDDSYNSEVSRANKQRSRALEDFGIQRDDTIREKQDALGRVDTNSRVLNDSVRRLLGQASGSGSSAYQLAAPNAVARLASTERGGVLEDYGENERNLALAETRAKSDFEELLEDLARQRRTQESELRGEILEQKQGINTGLGDVAGERARLLGGGYDEVRLAQQPFQSAYNQQQNSLDSLFERFRNPVLKPKAVNVQKPELQDYTVDRQAINANRQGGASPYAPYAQPLRRDDDEQQLPF